MDSKFSIIIPVKQINNFIKENVSAIIAGSYQSFEIIILVDNKENNESFPKTRIIETGKIGPAEKRDIGANKANGEFLAFIDDDVYPSKDWLLNALNFFENKNISAVCGPGVTPVNDNVMQKVSGWISATVLGGGPYTYRFIPKKERFVDDFPSMNFIIRKKDFIRINGFDSNYWPGEDTKLCLELIKLNKKIIYSPKVLVYHHRRPIFKKHLIQNGNYGIHRGYFAKILPQTSFRLSYFIPSLFAFGFIFGPLFYFINREVFNFYLFIVGLYFSFVIISSSYILIKEKNLFIALLYIPAIISTHLYYGIKFIQGYLFTKKLIK